MCHQGSAFDTALDPLAVSCDDDNTWKKNQLQKSTDLWVSTALELPVSICLLEHRSHKWKKSECDQTAEQRGLQPQKAHPFN